jgi:hypothetical protein
MSDESLRTVLERLDRLESDIDKRFAKLEADMKETGIRVDAYQKSSTQVMKDFIQLVADMRSEFFLAK